MTGQVSQLFAAWSPPQQTLVQGTPPSAKQAAAEGMGGGAGAAAGAAGGAGEVQVGPAEDAGGSHARVQGTRHEPVQQCG